MYFNSIGDNTYRLPVGLFRKQASTRHFFLPFRKFFITILNL